MSVSIAKRDRGIRAVVAVIGSAVQATAVYYGVLWFWPGDPLRAMTVFYGVALAMYFYSPSWEDVR